MSESYEKLAGAEGRERFFRPKRYAAKPLFYGQPPVARFEDQEFQLRDVSIGGAGCVADGAPQEFEAGRAGLFRLTQSGQEIFRAQARLIRMQQGDRGVVVGLALKDRFFDLEKLVRLNAAALALQADAGFDRDVGIEYKGYCAEVLNFVGGYLERIEKNLGPIESKLSASEAGDIVSSLAIAAAGPWRTLLESGNDLVIPYLGDKPSVIRMKAFTERVVTRELIGGASWRRSYLKPMGYPGDYQIMNYMYDAKPEGASLRDQFLHMLGVIAGKPIVSRMEKLAELVVDKAALLQRAAPDPMRIMSIGCGPARELEQILDRAEPDTRWRAMLIDQEVSALEFATRNAAALSAGGRLEVSGLNVSFKELFSAAPYRSETANQDVIYSAGLVDYFNPLLARKFVHRMYDLLRPGGRLIIGNVNNARTGTLWPMEFILDWSLYFRSRKEMVDMASSVEGADVSIVEDDLQAIYFLVVDKPEIA